MPTMYKTPGVYVEEIPKFPPSIAPVETAIPAFVGYTEKAQKIAAGDLLNVPTKIGSLTEYEFYFGVGAKLTIEEVLLDDKKNFKSAKIDNEFYMYDSLRLFYANGGGDCYIVSIGNYDSEGKTPTATHFTDDKKGIKTLEKVDEPTILVFPDNSLLTSYKDVYDAALAQCGSLQDRVGLFHVNKDDPHGIDFRSKTGIKDLKYGMAYSPWLEVSFPKNITYRDFYDKILKGTSSFKLADSFDGKTDNNDTSASLISAYQTTSGDVDTIINNNTILRGSYAALQDQFGAFKDAYNKNKTISDFNAIMKYLFDFARTVDVLVGTDSGKVNDLKLKEVLKSKISGTLKDIYKKLISYDLELKDKVSTYTLLQFNQTPNLTATEWGDIFNNSKYTFPVATPDKNPVKASNVITGTTDVEKMNSMLAYLNGANGLFTEIEVAWENQVLKTAQDAKTERYKALASSFPIAALIFGYETVMKDVDTINDTTKGKSGSLISSPNTSLREQFTQFDGAYLGSKTVANFSPIVNYLFEFARKIDVLVGSGEGSVKDGDLKKLLQDLISSTLITCFKELIDFDQVLVAGVSGYKKQYGNLLSVEWGSTFNNPPISTVTLSGTSDIDKMSGVLPNLRTLFDKINSAWLGSVVDAARKLEIKKHEGLAASFPLYNTILAGLQNSSTYVPPSGAVAGIYAYVDRTRGVWKAPANVSISGIIGPKDTFTASELDALNVDPNSGKSINAIRSFTGKGTLVYGARTLTGNDNEWRYVSVRRFFNFVEESTKKATEQFVFEPNDANTWVRIQGMIENFLTVLWRQGALQGIKPEHAFYVAVGLGKTMTPLDILEGRLIIEIGMAAVRPAEFIILRFSHKMAES